MGTPPTETDSKCIRGRAENTGDRLESRPASTTNLHVDFEASNQAYNIYFSTSKHATHPTSTPPYTNKKTAGALKRRTARDRQLRPQKIVNKSDTTRVKWSGGHKRVKKINHVTSQNPRPLFLGHQRAECSPPPCP